MNQIQVRIVCIGDMNTAAKAMDGRRGALLTLPKKGELVTSSLSGSAEVVHVVHNIDNQEVLIYVK